MSTAKHHCVLVHSKVIEAVWVLAVSQEEAKHMARARVPNEPEVTITIHDNESCSQ